MWQIQVFAHKIHQWGERGEKANDEIAARYVVNKLSSSVSQINSTSSKYANIAKFQKNFSTHFRWASTRGLVHQSNHFSVQYSSPTNLLSVYKSRVSISVSFAGSQSRCLSDLEFSRRQGTRQHLYAFFWMKVFGSSRTSCLRENSLSEGSLDGETRNSSKMIESIRRNRRRFRGEYRRPNWLLQSWDNCLIQSEERNETSKLWSSARRPLCLCLCLFLSFPDIFCHW
jgi:hypothetical protein